MLPKWPYSLRFQKSEFIINKMDYLLIKNGLVVSGGKIDKKNILVHDGIIVDSDFEGKASDNCEIIDAEACYVSAGFIDMHVHGGGGYDIMDNSIQAFTEISRIHLVHGTTTMLPTAVSASFGDILKLIEVYCQAQKYCPNFYGLHLEGPFISKKQKGAHKEYLLHAPSVREVDTLIAVGGHVIKRITAAPELDNMDYFSNKMRENGILLSIGHSDATSSVAKTAFKKGFSLITHFYNATTSIRKIDQEIVAGINEAALLDPNVAIEIIADGKHTAVESVQLAVKIKGTDSVAFVTDALRPTGLNVSKSYLGEEKPENLIIIEDGVAKLPDRSSFAGSIATSNKLLENGIKHYGFSVEDTVKMLTETPARILGLEKKGLIKTGYIADIVIFDKELQIKDVVLNGKIIERGNNYA